MPTTSTETILKAAADLGKLIAEHDSAQKLEALEKQLSEDIDAQRLIADYSRHVQTLQEKEQSGKPIEVSDKKKLDELQRGMVLHPLLGQMQTVQMDYLDLMRQVDVAINPAGQAPPPSN